MGKTFCPHHSFIPITTASASCIAGTLQFKLICFSSYKHLDLIWIWIIVFLFHKFSKLFLKLWENWRWQIWRLSAKYCYIVSRKLDTYTLKLAQVTFLAYNISMYKFVATDWITRAKIHIFFNLNLVLTYTVDFSSRWHGHKNVRPLHS